MQSIGDLLEGLNTANEVLAAQNKMTAKYEIVLLLVHDLGHKALQTTQSFNEFSTEVKHSGKEDNSQVSRRMLIAFPRR